MAEKPPRWDLSNVYPGLKSNEFNADFKALQERLDEFDAYFESDLGGSNAQTPLEELAPLVGGLIDRLNNLLLLSNTLRYYIYAYVTTDSGDELAQKRYSAYEQLRARVETGHLKFKRFIGDIAVILPEVIAQNETARDHAFILNEAAQQSRYLMSPAEEDLAAELFLSGARAWSKLQGTVTSQIAIEFELNGETQELSMPALINLRSHPQAEVRERAYRTELKAWEELQEPLAGAMNGVKGGVSALDRRRGRQDALHSAIDTGRIDRETLEVMLEAMQDSLPKFRQYFQAKAARYGREKLPWWDLFAPTGKTGEEYPYNRARGFILEHFDRFSPELSTLAKRAFDKRWIDAEQRVGKRGGAFCISIPKVKESRVLCNFDGSLDQVFTIAHELGHAFHNYCRFQAKKTELQRITPMTLAETASIMCETIVFEAAAAQVSDPQEELAILETALISDSQVIVDIYSRFLFEKEVFERRGEAELSARELCELMETAQRSAYGEGLDEKHLHRFMWTWKPHYYYVDLNFYNFPYAFGLLFGVGLYAIYQQQGEAFVPDYMDLLASTGEGSAADLAARFGINIRQRSFWDDSLAVIGRRIDRYMAL